MILDDDEDVVVFLSPLAIILRVTEDLDLAISIMEALTEYADKVVPQGFTPAIVFSQEAGIGFYAVQEFDDSDETIQ